MFIASCPECGDSLTFPSGASLTSRCRCPLCTEEFALEDCLSELPPMAELLDGEGAGGGFSPAFGGGGAAVATAPRTGAIGTGTATRPRAGGAATGARRGSAAKKKGGNPVFQIAQIVVGGGVGVFAAVLIIWWLIGTDPFSLGPPVAKFAPFLVPADLRGDGSGAPANGMGANDDGGSNGNDEDAGDDEVEGNDSGQADGGSRRPRGGFALDSSPRPNVQPGTLPGLPGVAPEGDDAADGGGSDSFGGSDSDDPFGPLNGGGFSASPDDSSDGGFDLPDSPAFDPLAPVDPTDSGDVPDFDPTMPLDGSAGSFDPLAPASTDPLALASGDSLAPASLDPLTGEPDMVGDDAPAPASLSGEPPEGDAGPADPFGSVSVHASDELLDARQAEAAAWDAYAAAEGAELRSLSIKHYADLAKVAEVAAGLPPSPRHRAAIDELAPSLAGRFADPMHRRVANLLAANRMKNAAREGVAAVGVVTMIEQVSGYPTLTLTLAELEGDEALVVLRRGAEPPAEGTLVAALGVDVPAGEEIFPEGVSDLPAILAGALVPIAEEDGADSADAPVEEATEGEATGEDATGSTPPADSPEDPEPTPKDPASEDAPVEKEAPVEATPADDSAVEETTGDEGFGSEGDESAGEKPADAEESV